MSTIKYLMCGCLITAGLSLASNTAHAQYTPGFQIQQTRFTPLGGIYNVNQSVQPYYGGTQSYQSNYINPWNGVTFGRQIVSNSYGTTEVAQSYSPWYGTSYSYQYAPPVIVNPQMAFYYGHPVVYNPQIAAYNNARYRPGFTWNGRWNY